MQKNDKWLTTDIVLVDIIGFSKLSSKQQYKTISYLTNQYSNMISSMLEYSKISLDDFIIGFIPTGDGFFCILNQNFKGYGVILGLNFNYLSEQITAKHKNFKGVRIAVHTGEVREFTDILGHTNYIGDGLNDCARYLELKQFNISTVTVSDIAYEGFKIFLNTHKYLKDILVKMQFKRSQQYTFHDKHVKEKKAYVVWQRYANIINPPTGCKGLK